MEKRSKSVTVENLFEGQKTAGLPFGDWLALSPAEKLIERLSFILNRAEAMHNQPHTDGLPAELWSLSKRLDNLIRETLSTIRNDFVSAYDQMIDIGMIIQEIRLLPALHSALKTWAFEVDALNELEESRQSGLIAHNKKNQDISQIIKDEAKELFAADKDKELKTGDVTKLLKSKSDELHEARGVEPVKLAAVRGWVREVAPDYAKKGGRPKKESTKTKK